MKKKIFINIHFFIVFSALIFATPIPFLNQELAGKEIKSINFSKIANSSGLHFQYNSGIWAIESRVTKFSQGEQFSINGKLYFFSRLFSGVGVGIMHHHHTLSVPRVPLSWTDAKEVHMSAKSIGVFGVIGWENIQHGFTYGVDLYSRYSPKIIHDGKIVSQHVRIVQSSKEQLISDLTKGTISLLRVRIGWGF